MILLRYLVFALLGFPLSILAQDAHIVVDESVEFVNLSERAEFIITDSQQQLSDVQKMQDWGEVSIEGVLPQGKSLWGHVSFYYQKSIPSRYTFIINNPNLDFVDIYLLDEQGRILQSALTGAKRPFANRPFNFREFAMPFELEPGENVEVYYRLQDDGPLVFANQFWKSTSLIKQEQKNITVMGAFIGALAVLACYFLVTYVLLRSPVRFWFAVASMVFLLLFLNIEGVLAQFTGVTVFMSEITTILLSLAIFCAAKVSHSMLDGLPKYWRTVTYLCSILMFTIALVFNAYWQIILTAGLGAAVVLLQLALAIRYRNSVNSLPNKVYAAGWLTISSITLIHAYLFLNGELLTTSSNLQFSFLLMFGVLLIAVAVEAHEKVLIHTKHEEQRNTISDLRRFYDFFKNSAEGMFSSTPEGTMITVNPAMCQLFGYEDEEEMLSVVKDASQIYVNQMDRQHLVGRLLKDGSAIGREIRGKRKDGSEFWFAISVQIKEEDGEKLLFGSIVDITERKQSDISLEYLATHDSLTGVYNRRHFETQLSDAIKKAENQEIDLTLLYLDLDQFKAVNDSCGHNAGDALIKELARKLNGVVKQKGILGRMGGDEFAVLLMEDQAELAYMLANQLLNLVREFRFVWDNRIFSLGVSIGLVEKSEKVTTPEQLMSLADAACYVAKEKGRNQIHKYSTEDEHMQRYEAELKWLGHINEALEKGNFTMYYQHYQPLRKVSDGHHYELLLRIHEDDGQVIMPGSFLPAAERYNLISKIDRWVVENYLKWLSENPEHLAQLNRCNINLSGHSLADKDLKLFFLQAFERFGVPYEKICFEITESMAIVKMDETLQFIKTFHQLGCHFALDDFGSGFSSYEYLKKLPVDMVKIDGSFVKDILVDPIDMAMVCSMKDVARAMEMETVAEFVESKEIMVELGKIGVDYAQGYGVAKPDLLTEFKPYVSIEKDA